MDSKSTLAAATKLEGNNKCADCGASGIFICLNCAGCHRSLGTHISKVLSATLDEWTDTDSQFMLNSGNLKSNLKFKSPDYELNDATPQNIRQAYIHAKYTGIAFAIPEQKKTSHHASEKLQALQSNANTVTGVLAIDLTSAKGLKAGDINGSSDPYVIFKISKNQMAKSKVIDHTLNPVWNEKLMLNCGLGDNVFVEVFDEDTVGSDDLLGTLSFKIVAEFKDGQPKKFDLPLNTKGTIQFTATYTHLA